VRKIKKKRLLATIACFILSYLTLTRKFTEYKRTYFGETKVFECRLVEKKAREVVILYEMPSSTTFAGITFHTGSKSFGYFWTNRNYNAYHWKDANGKTIIIYFNISKDTKIFQNKVAWKDMIVDIVYFPNGEISVLDESEIPSNIDPHDLKLIERTKEEFLSYREEITSELEKRTSSFFKIFQQKL
jgi:protein associated with RNAse G/E